MSAEDAPLQQQGGNAAPQVIEASNVAPKPIQSAVFGVFIWCLLGISLIFGVRLWHDLPLHPTFLPFIAIAFSAILAYATVMSFRSTAGEISLEAGAVKLKGAAGPVLFWNISFVCISYGMYLLGVVDLVKAPSSADYRSCSVLDAALARCPPPVSTGKAVPAPQPSTIPASSPASQPARK